MTSIWGKDVSSFDLPEDYVKDYLKEKKATKLDEGPELEPTFLETSPNLLMIVPLSSKELVNKIWNLTSVIIINDFMHKRAEWTTGVFLSLNYITYS